MGLCPIIQHFLQNYSLSVFGFPHFYHIISKKRVFHALKSIRISMNGGDVFRANRLYICNVKREIYKSIESRSRNAIEIAALLAIPRSLNTICCPVRCILVSLSF